MSRAIWKSVEFVFVGSSDEAIEQLRAKVKATPTELTIGDGAIVESFTDGLEKVGDKHKLTFRSKGTGKIKWDGDKLRPLPRQHPKKLILWRRKKKICVYCKQQRKQVWRGGHQFAGVKRLKSSDESGLYQLS